MRTNNLKDLRELNGGLVFSCKPTNSPRIVKEYDDLELVLRIIPRQYRYYLSRMKKQVNEEFAPTYGRSIYFADTLTSEHILEIQNIMKETGKSLSRIAKDLQGYVGYKCSFFRKRGYCQIPIEVERIKKAYLLIEKKASFIEIENVLYL